MSFGEELSHSLFHHDYPVNLGIPSGMECPLNPIPLSFIAWVEKVRVRIKRVLLKNMTHRWIHRTIHYYLHLRLVTRIPCSTNEDKVSPLSLDCILFRWVGV